MMSDAHGPNPPDQSDNPFWKRYVTGLLSSIFPILLVGGLLFAVSGVWPPLMAIESESMEPNIQAGDLVFVMEEERFSSDAQHGDTGIVTANTGRDSGEKKFQKTGDVIVYAPDGNTQTTPLIHRAMFWVNDNENWYEKANSDNIRRAENCDELPNCPAPHAGFITKGDNSVTNRQYDQVVGLSSPVRPDWIIGTVEARVPWLGCIRLKIIGNTASADQCNIL